MLVLISGALSATLLAAFDLTSRRLPDIWNLVLALSGLGFWFSANELAGRLPGIVFGIGLGVLLFLALRHFFLVRRKIEALGLGDIKLIAAIACWTGLGGLAVVLIVASAGTLLAVVSFRLLLSGAPIDRTRAYAFGPGLLAGMIAALTLDAGFRAAVAGMF